MALEFGVHIPFVHLLGFELTRFDSGQSEIRWAPRPEHFNSFEVTHGGAVMTLLDVTLASAARSVQPELGVVTIEMKTSFMQPARGPLVARGELMHRTRSTAFVQATLYGADGAACAHATGTFRYVVRKPAGDAAAAPLPTD